MELNLEEDEDWNDAQMWQAERAPDDQQQELKAENEPQFERSEMLAHDPRGPFREYPVEGNQWAPHSQNFAFDGEDRDFHRYHRYYGMGQVGRWNPYYNEPFGRYAQDGRGESVAELLYRPRTVRSEEVRGYGPAHLGLVGRYRPDTSIRQPVVNIPRYRENTFQFPTRFGGKFARAMSTMANNTATAPTGNVGSDYTDDSFKREVSQALAIKLNLKTRQHADEKMLYLFHSEEWRKV